MAAAVLFVWLHIGKLQYCVRELLALVVLQDACLVTLLNDLSFLFNSSLRDDVCFTE